MTEIVKAGAERLDELEPLWEALRQHHHAVMPSLGPLRERGDSWRRRRAHYERLLAEPGAFLLVVEPAAGEAERAAGEAERAAGKTEGAAGMTEGAAGEAEGAAGEAERAAGEAERAGDPALLGYALVSTGSASQTWAIDSGATLETIVLLPEARGRGLGSALIERVKQEVRAAGLSRLGLGVVAGNADAIRFYRRHGFEPAFVEMIARP